ncbi:MAG: Nif3-like dinuclear metal center hexameric protein [Bacillota bacterium]
MPLKAKQVVALIEKLAPPFLAASWDNSGWQVGDSEKPVYRVLLSLDVKMQVIDEAIRQEAQLIICHHPLLFKPFRQIMWQDNAGQLVHRLIERGIGLYAAHTNLDLAPGGVNDVLARLLDLQEVCPLREEEGGNLYKLVVFVPVEHVDQVREAVCRAGAGHIGCYDYCTFQVPGTGTYRPLSGAQPFKGKVGEICLASEMRLETIIPAGLVKRVVAAMLQAHPYEEVAYDLYKLENKFPGAGLGRVGSLEKALPLAELAGVVKQKLGCRALRFGGEPERLVRKVAVCGGSGGELWRSALSAGADVLITGDIGYHLAGDMLAAGMCFIDAGHFETEQPALLSLQQYLQQEIAGLGEKVEVLLSHNQRSPFNYC